MDQIISNFKKSIKTVLVNINDQTYEIPISYSMSAHKVYDDKIKKCNDKMEAFYTMLFEMIQSNWKIINDDIPFTLEFKDMKAISKGDIEKIIEIIYRESGYFTQLESVLGMKDTSSYEKFYLLHEKEKKELDKLNKKMKKITDTTFKETLPKVPNFNNIAIRHNHFSWINEHIETINRVNELYNNNVVQMIERFQMQNVVNSNRTIIEAANMFSQQALEAMANIKAVTGIFDSDIFATVKNAMINSSRITNVIEHQRILFSETMMDYRIAFEAQDRIREFVEFTNEISRRITPFLFDLNAISIAQNHLKAYLKNRTKKLYGLGWCIGNIEHEEVIERLYSDCDKLSDEEISEIITNYFESNNYEVLDKLVSSWEQMSYYQPFLKLSDDAVNFYKMGKYWPGVDAFTIMLEGAIRNFANDRYKVFETSIWKYITPLKKESDELMDYLTEYFFVQFKAYYASFSPENTEVVPDFNRNKIKHGIITDYDKKEYVLKLILMVNDILMIISSLSEMEAA
ncbi:hypothetical protein [Alkaliphilus serpentinus]|uniref:Uncharacterized protein n=1 Tax=Alkaliphilus serpentinus TaxID=1482731 RepID=A0A833MCY3_9FIRM|nr:hypothetical protein [Alkaliphilus serpentinus]KAB3527065.1 hypothetical protein F8153_12865 [Alkaliphilus serpentinus]